MVRLTRSGVNRAEDVPIITDIHVRVIAIAASVQLSEPLEAKSSQSPFPSLEAARAARPIAPTNEKTKNAENAIKLGMRGSPLLYLNFNTELRQRSGLG